LPKTGALDSESRIGAAVWRPVSTCHRFTRPDTWTRPPGCAKAYAEKASGAKTDRAELTRLLKRLAPGDVLVVTRLDRLARSTRDLLNILDAIGKAGAGFKSLADAWADTTTPHGRLLVTILGGLAEFERELIRARTDDGRKRAKARGVRFGRPLKLTAHQRQEAIERPGQRSRWPGLRTAGVGRMSRRWQRGRVGLPSIRRFVRPVDFFIKPSRQAGRVRSSRV
jgi:hypothetical protein